jgi:hypothetical protein
MNRSKYHYLHTINFLVPVQLNGDIDPLLFVSIKAALHNFYFKQLLHMAIAYGFLQVLKDDLFILEYGNVNLFFVKGWQKLSLYHLLRNVNFN